MSKPNKLYYKTCREQAGLTQEQAIVLLGISEVSTLSKYENGHLPVNSSLAAEMAKVYRVPSLAIWHLKYANPELARYLPEVSTLVTDGDMALQMELADDDISDIRKAIKAILRDGAVSAEEAEQLKLTAQNLREVANKISSILKLISSIKLGTVALVGAIILAALLVEDFINFMQGNDSLLGAMLQKAGVDCDALREKIRNTWDNIKKVFQSVAEAINGVIGSLFASISKLWGAYGGEITNKISNVIVNIVDKLNAFSEWLVKHKDTVIKFGGAIASIVTPFMAVKKVVSVISSLKVAEKLVPIFNTVNYTGQTSTTVTKTTEQSAGTKTVEIDGVSPGTNWIAEISELIPTQHGYPISGSGGGSTTTGSGNDCVYKPNDFSPASLSGVSDSDKISVISYTPKSASIIIGAVTTTVNAGGVVTGTSDTRETTTKYSYLSVKVTYYKYSSKTMAYRSFK